MGLRKTSFVAYGNSKYPQWRCPNARAKCESKEVN